MGLVASSAEENSLAEEASAAPATGTQINYTSTTLESSTLTALESNTAEFGHGGDKLEKATGLVTVVDPSRGGGSGGISQEHGQTRAHHQALDPPLMATQGNHEVSGIAVGSEVVERSDMVERSEVMERKKHA